jgi:nitrate reductase NapAB chaperone NapD
MPVSAYVIRCTPEDRPEVLNQLRGIDGVQIGTPTDTGIPIATEADTTQAASDLGARLEQLRGVKSAVLVYHNFEDMADAAL